MKSLDSFLVACHTDNVSKGGTFVAIKGEKSNGVDYIIDAIKRGAKKVVVQQDNIVPVSVINYMETNNIQLFFVKNVHQSLAKLSAKAYGYQNTSGCQPRLSLIAITGTKGKTSTAFILHHILESCGKRVALLSTVYNRINSKKYKATLTTAQPDYLYAFFDQCFEQDVEIVVMEVSAQALSLNRVDGLKFDAVIFTNFSQEHGEFYNSLEDYFNAKCLLFKQLKIGSQVFVNSDDKWGQKILKKNKNFFPFTSDHINDQKIVLPQTNLLGDFNKYNMVSACAVACTFGITLKDAKKALQSFEGIPGRLEKYILKNGARCFIDYAHSPSSYKSVLSTLRKMTDDLIVVFGCAGDRDKIKRPQMGAVATEICDKVFITSDNPRSEKFEDILEDIMFGIVKNLQNKVVVEKDRKLAIKQACKESKKNSIIAVLGKGPDEYQIIGTHRFYFSDKKVILSLE